MSHHWSVRAVSAPSADTDASLLVTFDNAKFLFDCGEGTQRAFVQGKMSLRKLQGVFLTGAGNEVVGGLPGILMSAADAGVKQTVVAGPEGLYQYLASCRTFVQRDSLAVDLPHPAADTHEIHKTASITIKAVSISSSSSSPSFTVSTHAAAAPSAPPPPPPSTGAFHWKDRKVRLGELTDVQLRWWRRVVIADMFGGWRRYAEAGAGTSSASAPALENATANGHGNGNSNGMVAQEDHRSSPARFHMPHVIPLHGADAPSPSPVPPGGADRMAYILQAPPVRGKFNADKARALGVPNGPIRGRLTKGEAIEVDDQGAPGGKRTIRPEDVLGETVPGAVCIIVDVAPEHIASLVAHDAFRLYMADAGINATMPAEHQTHLIVHRATAEVLADERYRHWMRAFGPHVHHLVADPAGKSNDITFSSAAWNLLRMSQLDSDVFAPPLLGDASPSLPVVQAETVGAASVQPLRKGLSVKMHPPQAPEQLPDHPNNPSFPASIEAVQRAREELAAQVTRYRALTTEAQRCVAQAEQAAAAQRTEGSEDDTYGIMVVPLGTGSAVPSKYRNVSSTLLDIPGFGNMLLDAGEGTLGQLRRRFGAGLPEKVYKSLRFIFISHMHADHHLGLQRLLLDWQSHCPDQILYIVGPSYIWLHLAENGIRADECSNIRFMDCFHLMRSRQGSPTVPQTEYQEPGPSRQERTLAMARECTQTLGLVELHAPLVTHRGRAHGLVIEHSSGWKIAYSGDTTPCQALVDAGKNATLLIHEATLEDDKPDMALAKGHSTFGQAIEVGTKMQARYLLLNHFSQRYPKLPRLQPADPSAPARPVIALAFDLMALPLASFWKMAHYTEALEELFREVEAAESDTGSEVSVAADKKQVGGKQNGKGKADKKGGKSKQGGGAAQKRKLGEVNAGKAGNGGAGGSRASPAAKRTKSGESDVVVQVA